MKKFNNLTASEIALLVIFALVLGIGIIAFQAWLLGIVLGWFGVVLGFWKNVVIVLLINMLFGARSSSN